MRTAERALQVLDDYLAIHGDRWRQVTEDNAEATALLEPALAKYQARTHVAGSINEPTQLQSCLAIAGMVGY